MQAVCTSPPTENQTYSSSGSWVHLAKRNLFGQPKAGAKHPLLGRHVSDVPDGEVRCVGSDFVANLPADFGADLLGLGDVVVALGAEAVGVNHRQLLGRVGGEEIPDIVGGDAGDIGVEADEVGQEGDGGGREVHDVVGKDARLDERFERLGLDVLVRGCSREFRLWVDGDRAGVAFE